ncbi:hypothetical protein PV325_013684, partial [Microctonus aethiopoides]
DINARTGTESGAEAGSGEVNEVERVSQDKVVNSEGKRLIGICKELVLDVVLAVERGEGWDGVKLKVEERTESDHLPISLWVTDGCEDKEGQSEQERSPEEMEGAKESKLKWKEENREDYVKKIHDLLRDGKGAFWDDMRAKIWRAANETNV